MLGGAKIWRPLQKASKNPPLPNFKAVLRYKLHEVRCSGVVFMEVKMVCNFLSYV